MIRVFLGLHFKLCASDCRVAALLFSIAPVALSIAMVGCGPSSSALQPRVKAEESFIVHVVSKKKETPAQIAKWYTGSPAKWKEILKANAALQGKQSLKEGELVLIPVKVATKREHMPVEEPKKVQPKPAPPTPAPRKQAEPVDASQFEPLETYGSADFVEDDPFLDGGDDSLEAPDDSQSVIPSVVRPQPTRPLPSEAVSASPGAPPVVQQQPLQQRMPLPIPQQDPGEARQKTIEELLAEEQAAIEKLQQEIESSRPPG